MSKLQNFVIAMVMLGLGIASWLQVLRVDHVVRVVSIMGIGSLAALGALIFFAFAFKDRA